MVGGGTVFRGCDDMVFVDWPWGVGIRDCYFSIGVEVVAAEGAKHFGSVAIISNDFSLAMEYAIFVNKVGYRGITWYNIGTIGGAFYCYTDVFGVAACGEE